MDDETHEVRVSKKPIRLKNSVRNNSLNAGQINPQTAEEPKGSYLKKEMYKNDKYA
jgi:hypothetical protein